jgi:hypothetical protein
MTARSIGTAAVRGVFLTHRYLGIAVSVLMVTWCLSGVVMMYVSYPTLPERARLAALAPLDLARCCASTGASPTVQDEIASALVEMLGGRPVARLTRYDGGQTLIDLADGQVSTLVSEVQASGVASRFAQGRDLPGRARVTLIENDQWVTSERFDGFRPYYRFCWADPDHSCLYVSAATGQAMQWTTRWVRFWNWLGPVPHWLYFSALRRHELLWSQLIIWTSLVGCFLTLTGLYVGLRQFLRRPEHRWTPYRGFMAWHHIPGVLFGLFALTWVASGLLSMNPWGLLEGDSARPESAALAGSAVSWPAVRASVAQLAHAAVRDGLVSVESGTMGGRLYWIGSRADGSRVRLNETGQSAPLSAAELRHAGELLGGPVGLEPEWLATGDAFYFAHHSDPVALPVYRVIATDVQQTRYYLDPVAGSILRKVDRGAAGYRWLHEGLHRLDFSAGLRARPVWDVLMLLLMSGVTLLCISGLYFGTLRASGRRRSPQRTAVGQGSSVRSSAAALAPQRPSSSRR